MQVFYENYMKNQVIENNILDSSFKLYSDMNGSTHKLKTSFLFDNPTYVYMTLISYLLQHIDVYTYSFLHLSLYIIYHLTNLSLH